MKITPAELQASVIEVATSIRPDLTFTDFSRELLMECCEKNVSNEIQEDISLPQMQINTLTSFNNIISAMHTHITGLLQIADSVTIHYREKNFVFTQQSGI